LIVKNVTFHIKPDYTQKFIAATLENQRNSKLEKGVSCFDFLQCKDDPTVFLLYEGYISEYDMEEHLKTEHFNKWINTVEKWFSSPRKKVTYVSV
jgi:autoinducer 2-degrading protein